MKSHGSKALAGALLAFALAAPLTARAQLTGSGGAIGTTLGTTLTASDVFIGVQGTQNVNQTDLDLLTYFNQANCECDRKTWIFAALLASGVAKRNSFAANAVVDIWLGVSCDVDTLRSLQCDRFGTALLIQFAAQGGLSIESTAKEITRPHGTNGVQGTSSVGTGGIIGSDGGAGGAGGSVVGGGNINGDPCMPTNQVSTETIYALFDLDGNGIYDLSVSKQVPIDMTAPQATPSLSAGGGNQAVVVNWTSVDITSDTSGILGYQVLCARADQYQVFQTGAYSPSFQTAATNCPGTIPTGTGIENLDPAYLCSGLLSPSATSARIKILENDIMYGFRVVTIDKHLNPSSSITVLGTPEPSLDFYNVYRNDTPSMPGGTLDQGRDAGGYCAVPPDATAPHGRRWLALAAAGAAAAALVRARRRRRRPRP
ncbi:MAG TPA: hypothetical protein VMU50_22685 [Polyangia bacterium]|nr:hypothetical protein [Polyangia bacterium]